MAQRLMQVQRQRLAESRVADHRTRRVLHDEALPRLHAVALGLSGLQDPARDGFVAELTELHAELSALLRELPTAADEALTRLGLVGALRQLLADEMPEAFYRVAWEVDDATEAGLRSLAPLSAEVLFYAAREAIRNAARHGRGEDPSRPLRLTIAATRSDALLRLVIEDDGVGAASGSGWAEAGHGVALHSTMMAVLGGEWMTESRPAHGTRVTLSVPTSGPSPS
jgi:signal transduction histidine kinase